MGPLRSLSLNGNTNDLVMDQNDYTKLLNSFNSNSNNLINSNSSLNNINNSNKK